MAAAAAGAGPRSCGFALLRYAEKGKSKLEVLLMLHHNRYDMPKGHVDPGETDLQTAYRELEEETAFRGAMVKCDSTFRYVNSYPVTYRGKKKNKWPGTVTKTLVMFIAYVPQAHAGHAVSHTEHLGHEWVPLYPPRKLKSKAIDPLLDAIRNHIRIHGVLAEGGGGAAAATSTTTATTSS